MTPTDMLKAANEAWQAYCSNPMSDDPDRPGFLSRSYINSQNLLKAWLTICAEGDDSMVRRLEDYLMDNGAADGTVQAALAFVKAEMEA
jgi:hypothetical protein